MDETADRVLVSESDVAALLNVPIEVVLALLKAGHLPAPVEMDLSNSQFLFDAEELGVTLAHLAILAQALPDSTKH